MMDYLPHDVRVQIFLKLPAKTLLRCLSVCKLWQSFIQHPSFIEAHLQCQRRDLLFVRTVPECNKEKGLRFHRSDYENSAKDVKPEIYTLHCDDESFTEYAKFEFPVLHRSGEHYRVVGSCNGILCITDDGFGIGHQTYLWNPTIRKYVELPRPMFTFDKIGGFDHELGFGFDSKNNDYKVVRIVTKVDWQPRPPLLVEVYSLTSGIWKDASHLASDLSVEIFERCFSGREKQVYLNGSLHWVGWDRKHSRCMVIVFDISDEVFHCFGTPDDLEYDYFLSGRQVRPVVVQESLSLVQRTKKGCLIWVMKDYGVSSSWTKQVHVNLSDKVDRVIGIRKNFGLLIDIKGGLYCLDPEAMKGKEFNFLDKKELCVWKYVHEGPEAMDVKELNFLDGVDLMRLRLIQEGHMDVGIFGQHMCNYDPEAAPKDLGIRSRTKDFYRYSFHCESYIESLALVGRASSVDMGQVESKVEDIRAEDIIDELQSQGDEA